MDKKLLKTNLKKSMDFKLQIMCLKILNKIDVSSGRDVHGHSSAIAVGD